MGDNMIVVGGVNKILTTLQKGNRVNPVTNTSSLEYLVLW